MINCNHLSCLAIDSGLINPESANYQPTSWPPPDDFPIVIDADNIVVSKYSDAVWDLSLWAGKAMRLYFGEMPIRKSDPYLTQRNASLLRQLAAWWLWGPNAVRTPVNLKRRFGLVYPIFALCSKENIDASFISLHPKVFEKLLTTLVPSGAEDLLTICHALFEQREIIGFTLLNRECLRRLEAALPSHNTRQTPYIPARIWNYQLKRLREFLEDFEAHRDKIEACYKHCYESYFAYHGSFSNMFCRASQRPGRSPFVNRRTRYAADFIYEGAFSEIAERFGIEKLIKKWLLSPHQPIDSPGRSIALLSKYLTMTSKVGAAFLLNFTLMRIDEVWSLRSNCLDIEHDETFGDFFILRGSTSKTIQDDDACWIASPACKLAVEAMTCVSKLRMLAASDDPGVPCTEEDLSNSYLITRPYEPWSKPVNKHLPLLIRPAYPSYQSVIEDYPNLFDATEILITEHDIETARLITPSLNGSAFEVGRAWPFSWHQLRRTGAVNMQASGLVSDASIQYQLKHASRAMSLYYGKGYSKLRLHSEAQNQYIKAMYEVLTKEIAQLFNDRYVSPHGELRKQEILKLVTPNENQTLIKAAQNCQLQWRETLLGGCTKRGFCEYGGIDNIARCGGGDDQPPCPYALYDKNKSSSIQKLKSQILSRLKTAAIDSPYFESLKAQLRAVENSLNVINTTPKNWKS